jgi:hypothetical protein
MDKPTGTAIYINFDPSRGVIDIKGPTENPVLFLGLIEFAKASVISQLQQAPKEEPMVQPVASMPDLTGGKN